MAYINGKEILNVNATIVPIKVDQTYNPESENAQSGIAVAEAISKSIVNIEEELQFKVDKVEGKGLSSNDYTSAEKEKLAGIENGAQVNITPDQIYNPESENAQSGKAVAGVLKDYIKEENIKTINGESIVGSGDISISGGNKEWTLLYDITLEEAVGKITLPAECKEVYAECIFNLSEDKVNTTPSVFFQTDQRLVMASTKISEKQTLYMRGEIIVTPSGRLKGVLNIDTNSLGYTRASIESTLSTCYANENGNIGSVNIQLATMEIGSTIKIWGR